MTAEIIGPVPRNTPAAGPFPRPDPRDLPADILRQASLRLGIFSLVVAVLWILGVTLGHVADRFARGASQHWLEIGATDLIAGGSIVLSLALFGYTRLRALRPQFALDLGLVYMVVMSLALGTLFHWGPVPANWSIMPQISWVGVMLLIFAAIVPTSTPKLVVAGFVAVAMNPLGMVIAAHRGIWDFGSAWNAVLMHYPDFLLVGVAVVISHVVRQLGWQVRKAR